MIKKNPLLKLRNLHVSFLTAQGTLPVLHGISLEIAPGEAFALIGESGSGKSVTAQAVMQLLGTGGRITSGEILFHNESLHNKTSRQMQGVRGKKIGMVFQDPMTSLNPTLLVGRQITESLMYHDGLSAAAARKQAIELLAHVGIADPAARFNDYPFQLSGGMRQRVMIAMAIACKPLLLIADEPTTALDVTVQAQILELLSKTKREIGMSVLLITHDLGVVASICDRAAVMRRGAIVETGDVASLLLKPNHPYTRSLLAARQDKS